ncbi:hypothetical protein FHS19_000807 [Paenibacillus rhizosphaerae]|uniref:Uncharacterized protein n=1 Tax=Paenibacillus rhizosphaerae TaxID=297318 RepID=A0A839TI14_9BACL|nr:hypothetical protein [Paenibacillus rhizosphaerae]MBB3126153.1 hypothetical protein [Paenibacillus rhizosphaerae]
MGNRSSASSTRFGIQGPVVAWQDPWAGDASDRVMRTGTGAVYPSQDDAPSGESFVSALQSLGADFYVHHVLPGMEGFKDMVEEMKRSGMDVCLGNEYGNINGPWADGTNRWDVPDEAVTEAAGSGRLIGLLYDEPEHLQINAAQYRKDGWHPHWGAADGLELKEAAAAVANTVQERVTRVTELAKSSGCAQADIPLIAEHVFPVMFHVHASGGMAVCPKIMKESFQALQLGTALGAAKQYKRPMWICADLWGPDIGHWFTRLSGFPGHSPEEFASALRMGYLMAPTHLFAENVDALLHHRDHRFVRTEFGEVWEQFIREYVPTHPLDWSHADITPDTVLIHADDSNYGQNARLFGSRTGEAEESTKSVFAAWHLLSHGTIPAHGSCMHIPGYDFPRHQLKRHAAAGSFPLPSGYPDLPQTSMHTLFHPVNNVIVFDETVRYEQLGQPKLILVAGSRLSKATAAAIRRLAEEGSVVVIMSWLAPQAWRDSKVYPGGGAWVVTDDFLSGEACEAAAPHLGSDDCWRLCFGEHEVRFYKGDPSGRTLDIEVLHR